MRLMARAGQVDEQPEMLKRARVGVASRERGVGHFCDADIGSLFVGCDWWKMRQGVGEFERKDD